LLQYKIPQNVGIEDKIVGPLTLRQLIYMAVGGGVSYVLFAIMSKLYELNIIEYILIAAPAVISAALALIKINSLSLSKYILLVIEFAMKPKKRLWDHRGISSTVSPNLYTTSTSTQKKDSKKINEVQNNKNVNLSDLSKILDSGGFDHLNDVNHKDIDNASDDDFMYEAFFGKRDDIANNDYWRSKKTHKQRVEFLAQLPKTELDELKKIKEQISGLKNLNDEKPEELKIDDTKPEIKAKEVETENKEAVILNTSATHSQPIKKTENSEYKTDEEKKKSMITEKESVKIDIENTSQRSNETIKQNIQKEEPKKEGPKTEKQEQILKVNNVKSEVKKPINPTEANKNIDLRKNSINSELQKSSTKKTEKFIIKPKQADQVKQKETKIPVKITNNNQGKINISDIKLRGAQPNKVDEPIQAKNINKSEIKIKNVEIKTKQGNNEITKQQNNKKSEQVDNKIIPQKDNKSNEHKKQTPQAQNQKAKINKNIEPPRQNLNAPSAKTTNSPQESTKNSTAHSRNRPRNKKREIPAPTPERKNMQINNLEKKKPTQFIEQNKPIETKPKDKPSNGEINFHELSGDGIEINLDN